MKKKFDNVYQFKIVLKGIKPPIWRRIQVPDTYSFWDLHVAIQDAMGWGDYHLHEFEMKNPLYGTKERVSIPEGRAAIFPGERRVYSGRSQKIADWFFLENKAATYTYDFGDDWRHEVRLEKILLREDGVSYPRCLAGARACPPEDCGGVWGYAHMLEVVQDPKHEEREDMIDWIGESFDPENFSIDDIEFDSPAQRWKQMFG